MRIRDTGSGMETVRIQDPGWKKVGSTLLLYLISGEGPPGDLPEDEAECVHVRRLEALEGGGDERLVQHLGGHVPPCSHSAHLAQVKGTLVCSNFFSQECYGLKERSNDTGSGHA